MSPAAILVVEDNERNLKLVRAVLEHAGYEVRAAGTAEEGVATALAAPPDLVLMDLQLPGMDGISALGALRADPATAGVPVVALTALAMPHDRERVDRAGFDGYLEKPISVRDLAAQVQAFLDRRGGTA
ncbi:MAG TPA: response regulator [Jiangellales bacterium]|nr:response regulator [Jiangellales bacterium]